MANEKAEGEITELFDKRDSKDSVLHEMDGSRHPGLKRTYVLAVIVIRRKKVYMLYLL